MCGTSLNVVELSTKGCCGYTLFSDKPMVVADTLREESPFSMALFRFWELSIKNEPNC